MNLVTQENFIDELAATIYTADSIRHAADYWRRRGIDPTRMAFPSAITPAGTRPFEKFSSVNFQSFIFEECIFMPILELETCMDAQPRLAGFDVRYLGLNPLRTRFQKFKRSPETVLLYNIRSALEFPDRPLIVTESVSDTQSLIQTDLPVNVISPLTAAKNIRFLAMLHALSNNVYFMYDNDPTGSKARKALSDYIETDMHAPLEFRFITYAGHDANEILKQHGANGQKYLRDLLMDQVFNGELPQVQEPAKPMIPTGGRIEIEL